MQSYTFKHESMKLGIIFRKIKNVFGSSQVTTCHYFFFLFKHRDSNTAGVGFFKKIFIHIVIPLSSLSPSYHSNHRFIR